MRHLAHGRRAILALLLTLRYSKDSDLTPGGSGKAEGLADGFSSAIAGPSASLRLPLPPKLADYLPEVA
jgi:hypothetical protein